MVGLCMRMCVRVYVVRACARVYVCMIIKYIVVSIRHWLDVSLVFIFRYYVAGHSF